MHYNNNYKKVVDYYKKSRLGYDLVLWGSRHFGFYPNAKKDISEKKAQELMQDLIAKSLDLKENQTVLDAGCGQGVVSIYLAQKYGCNIVGITIVPFEVEKARMLAKKEGVGDKVEYHLMDYSDTKFKNNQFDAIYTMEAFVHSPDIKKTLKEFYRILKPNGRLVMHEYTIADNNKFSDREKKIRDIVIEGSAMMALKNMKHDAFTNILKRAGFKSVKEQNISKHLEPSFRRLYNLSLIPYFFVKAFNLQKNFINITAGNELFKMAKKDLFRYCVFTARKPGVKQ